VEPTIPDYIGMVSLKEGACIAYTATFNLEEDIYFCRPELPITALITRGGSAARISWNSTPGVNYCLQAKTDLRLSWSLATNVACLTASSTTTIVDDPPGNVTRYYRVVREP